MGKLTHFWGRLTHFRDFEGTENLSGTTVYVIIEMEVAISLYVTPPFKIF